jgi:hypothetical protein
MNELFTRNLEVWRAEIQEGQPVEPEVHLRVDQAEQSAVVANASKFQHWHRLNGMIN